MKRRLPVILLLLLTMGACVNSPSWEEQLSAKLNRMADSLTQNLKPWVVPNRLFVVDDYGAISDGITLNTAAIQAAINTCSQSGGGVVLFPKGEYVTGTIEFRSGVMLEIAEGVKILGSTNLEDYPDKIAKRKTVMDTHMDIRHSLIYAENVERVGIRGPGTIDFRGTTENFPGKETIAKLPGRPFGMRFIDSKKIVVQNINLRNSPSWMQNYLHCTECILENINNENHTNHNQDGLDIDGCQFVIVRNCYFNVYDDAMCIKGASLKPTEDILIENSTFYTKCNGLKIGTDTQGDFRRIIARNLVLGGPPKDFVAFQNSSPTESGITLATVDGAIVEDIFIENVEINRVNCPIFLRIGNRGRLMPDMPTAPIGKLRNVIIDGVTGSDNLKQGSFISGIPDELIENVTIKNMSLSMVGGVLDQPTQVKENESVYPDAHQFNNPLPAYGFYVRHAKNITLDNIIITPTKRDQRPLFFSGGDVDQLQVNQEMLD